MTSKNKQRSVDDGLLFIFVIASAIAVRNGFTNNPAWYWLLAITVPAVLLVIRRKGGISHQIKQSSNKQSYKSEMVQAGS